LLRRGEVEGRWDVNFLRLSGLLQEKFQQTSFPLVKFGSCIHFIQYGISTLATKEESGLPMIRMNNLQDDKIDTSNLKFIELPDSEAQKYVLQKGDILFNRTNSKELVGKCAVFEEDGNWVFASYLIRVSVDTKKLLPKFVVSFLASSLGRLQIDCISRQIIGMTNINAEEIKILQIPLPSIELQQAVINRVEAAHAAKRAKEAEAHALLESIDGYVLSELGITLPDEERETVFRVPFSRVRGGRLDPSFYQQMGVLHSLLFPNILLATAAYINPPTLFYSMEKEVELSFVPMEVIDERYAQIVEERKRNMAEAKGYTRFQEDDLLWAKITPCMQNGKSAIARNLSNGYGFGSTEFHVIRAKENVSIDFLHCLLHLHIVRRSAMLDFAGSSGHQRVSSNFIEQLSIPLPPLAVQERIATEAHARRESAKALEREASEILAAAKAEVERMILG
jgi:restriction endonuclease S subunit